MIGAPASRFVYNFGVRLLVGSHIIDVESVLRPSDRQLAVRVPARAGMGSSMKRGCPPDIWSTRAAGRNSTICQRCRARVRVPGRPGSQLILRNADHQVQRVTEFVSFTNIRLPAMVGCAHVALSATV